jgi:hypothetical protein
MLAISSAVAETPALPVSVAVGMDQVTQALTGKVCTTNGKAKFTFKKDGHYVYDGMWTDKGHYSTKEGAVTILLDSGLERDFKISVRSGVLYMEDTAILCE